MASVPQRAIAPVLDRRARERSELCLGVTLRRAGTQDIIPAEITNLSATGFLARVSYDGDVPELLDVELPHGGSRTARVVWGSEQMLGCSFIRPLSRSEIGAAHLKSEPLRLSQADEAQSEVASRVDPADPIWDMASEARPHEKWPLRTRLLLIAAIGTLPWLTIAGLLALFA